MHHTIKKLTLVAGLSLVTFLLIRCVFFQPKKSYRIETVDIGHFWQAYNSLENAHNYNDSLQIIQHLYLDRMTSYGKKYIKAREYTAAEYIMSIRKYHRYFSELKYKTDGLMRHKAEIDSAFSKLNKAIPNYNIPDVCFAIGCFRGGGTITKNKDAVLVGCEIALADSTMDISEFTGTLHRMFSHASGNFCALIGHESIHCQEYNGQNNTLLSMALAEGTADFLTSEILQVNVDRPADYGMVHECELWKEFEPQMNSIDISQWLYNTSLNESRPADLGYFVGKRICRAYYNKQTDKKKAIIFMLDRGNYKQVFAESGYNGNCRN